jgi:hypothetical protein
MIALVTASEAAIAQLENLLGEL